MNTDELMGLFGLGDEPEGAAEAGDIEIQEDGVGAGAPAVPPSPNCIQVSKYDRFRAKELLDGDEALARRDLGGDEDARRHAVEDFNALAYEPDPRREPNCADPKRAQFVKDLMESADYRGLHPLTMLREDAAAIATASFAEGYEKMLLAEQKRGEKRKEDSKRGQPRDKGAEAEEDRIAALTAAAGSARKASEDVDEHADAMRAMGMGEGSDGSIDPKRAARLFRAVRGNKTLQRIVEMAGRYRNVARARQRQKVNHGLDDMVGVTLGGDLGHILITELAQLADPDLELLEWARIADRAAMQRDYRGVQPVAKGPIIVTVDESGSMQGLKAETAKALALTMAWIARRQNRWCALVAYSGDSGERLLALPPGRWNESAVMEWLCGFIGRGSNLDVPLREMPDYYARLKAPVGKTDVIFITDAICDVPPEVGARFLEWKRMAQARVISLVIDSEPGGLAAMSDETHRVRSLSPSEEAVERVLSV